MARPKKHKDVEFAVSIPGLPDEVVDSWERAAGIALEGAVLGSKSTVDILVYSKSGARWWMGDEGADMYDEDPEASVFQRIVVHADDLGRVP